MKTFNQFLNSKSQVNEVLGNPDYVSWWRWVSTQNMNDKQLSLAANALRNTFLSYTRYANWKGRDAGLGQQQSQQELGQQQSQQGLGQQQSQQGLGQ